MVNENCYKIGEISKLFNIGLDSLRYYEKVGILSPKRDPINNYRIYTLDDIREIAIIRELMELRFPSKQIKELGKNRNLSTSMELLEHEITVVNESIVNLYQIKESLNARLSSIKTILENSIEFYQIKILSFPERSCIMISETNLPDRMVTYAATEYMHKTKQKFPIIGSCDCYTLDLENSNPDSDYYKTENVFFYSENSNYAGNYFLPAGKYLSLLYRGDLKQTRKYIPKMFDFAKEHNLDVISHPIEIGHIDCYETLDEEEFITEIQIPVKPLKKRVKLNIN
ncbi:MerR family transcriptional regulator [Clostridium tyrobutyricum]|uniref:MerR family transcriptional regulator n=1 Tax=Clostridium tyrobutyricum TaxID=1519 RepID=UPI001C37F6F7|nr:MerR family transcriptional regulator [Clostridium tyrobutyricum]MBV4419669.1 MerR family transcriptional regulator [Clostridium tyrobutyricum]